MKKEEKESKGKTMPCSKCGHVLASRIKFVGFGWRLNVFCGNKDCASFETITLSQKEFVTVVSASLIIIFILFSFKGIEAERVTCKSFKTPDRTWREAQEFAQKYYDEKLPGWQRLDGWDKDGKVCEL